MMRRVVISSVLLEMALKEGHHINSLTVVRGLPPQAKFVSCDMTLSGDLALMFDVGEGLDGYEDTIVEVKEG